MKHLLLYKVAFLIAFQAFSQSIVWERNHIYTINEKGALHTMDTMSNGNILIYGSTVKDIRETYFVEYDKNGNLINIKPGMENIGWVWAGYLTRLKNGSFLYSNTKDVPPYAANDIILQRLDVKGDSLPFWSFGDNMSLHIPYKIAELGDGNILTASNRNGYMSLLKITSQGDSIWQKTYPDGSTGNDRCFEVIQNYKGNYVLLGERTFLTTPLSSHPHFIEVDPNGDTIATKLVTVQASQLNEEWHFGNVLQTADNDYVFPMVIDSLYPTNQVKEYGSLTLLDSSFNKKWSVILKQPSGNFYRVSKVRQLQDSSYLVLGCNYNWSNNYDLWKVSKNGTILNKYNFISSLYDSIIVNDFLFLNDSSIIVSGSYRYRSGGYLARIDNIGNPITIDTCKSFKASFNVQQSGDTIQFINTSKGGFSYADQSIWKFSDSTTSTTFNHKIEVIGIQDSIWARLIATNPYGCKDTIEKKIKVDQITDTADPLVNDDWKVIVYPNPSSDIFNFKNTGNNGANFKLSLLNSIGQQIGSFNFNSKDFSVDAQLSSGMYFYLLTDEEGNTRSGKLIVE